jgi:PAS domain S-box-containing protein
LSESEKKYRDIVELAPDGIVTVNMEGVIQSCNAAFQKMMDLSEDEIIGEHFSKLPTIKPRDVPRYRQMLKSIIAGNVSMTFETAWASKDGNTKYTETHASLMKKNGRTWGIQIIVTDITKRKEAEKVENVLNSIAKAANESGDLDEFLKTVHQQLGMLINTSNFYVALYDEETDTYSFPYHMDEYDTADNYEPQKLTKSLTDYVRRNGEPLLANQQVHAMLTERGEVEMVGTPSPIWMGVPLKTPQGVIGIIAVQSYTDPVLYSIKDLDALSLVSGTVAMAIERKRTSDRLVESYERLRITTRGMIDAMARTLEVRDPYTAGHQKRVAQLACAIGREMKLPDLKIDAIHMASVIHDIGKVNVPAEILSKPGQLSQIELRLIRLHPKVGYDILKDIEFPWPIADIILQHHERLDGSGYPNELKSDDILLEARILGVADVVEAMSSHRPHRSALGIETAFKEIQEYRGVRYDSKVVDACMKVLASKSIDPRWW